VSEFHLELASREAGVLVRDLTSRNGTYHAGARILEALVPSGALIELGRSALRVATGRVLSPRPDEVSAFGPLSGRSRAVRRMCEELHECARRDDSVTLQGGAGTGKTLLARAIHDASARANGPFVSVDCASLPPSLAEEALFSRAARSPGAIESARGGTLVLEEIGALHLDFQSKLAALLATSPTPTRRDARGQTRILCTTSSDLRRFVNSGHFREDLYARVSALRLTLPPLSERSEDVNELVLEFLRGAPPERTVARSISPEALELLRRADYPGNVRELRQIVERVASLAAGAVVTPADVVFERMLRHRASEPTAFAPDVPLFKDAKRSVLDEFERSYLVRLMQRTKSVTHASAIAGLERHYLRALLKRHAIARE
jgi:DNA-binding NtrC family response regulator